MDAADGIRQRTWKRYPRWARLMFILSVVAGLLYTLRHPLLRALGDHLIVEDPITRADAVLILGGSAMDRGSEAARLYADSVSKRFVFTGAPVPNDLRALGIDSTEARCTRAIAVERGIPFALTTALDQGTSTWEEAEALQEYCTSIGADTVIIVSNRFHLRRVRFVFKERFKQAGIQVRLHGAPSSTFNEADWWDSEEGLLMVNNEYVKLMYYHLKY